MSDAPHPFPDLAHVEDHDLYAEVYRVSGTPVLFFFEDCAGFHCTTVTGRPLEALTEDLRREFYGQPINAETAHAIAGRIRARYL